MTPNIEQLEQTLAAMKAHKAGKKVEFSNDNGKTWKPTLIPGWYLDTDIYRPAPWSLPDPPKGREWHRTDWTEDMLPDGWRPMLIDETVERNDEVTSNNGAIWTSPLMSLGCKPQFPNSDRYRTRRPLPADGPECEDAVIEKIRQRREKGREKYGQTMERTDLKTVDWLKHAQEEAMDLAVYLERVIRERVIALAQKESQ